ncbi:hypothetical protein KC363_g4104 [Hortaea werneckii]|nr:hypothetical protein KC325_g4787 [Hortaea werneckii]KAI6992763.1 hypothetical protein KC359_g5516 [Hortaea werneckii]KAI7145148.1 hypothetical protein KC344_g4755 [Hortaea werneckii]KAI7173568.1 hypothetical protein KC360_g4835 [Hortaea werneckii]KAI7190976.1 hypothetical protein KC363_g4104 [Hortaea werneckii]
MVNMRTGALRLFVCFAASSYASPIGSPDSNDQGQLEKRNILVPAYLNPTSTVDPATWPTSEWTGTPMFMPTSTVDFELRKRVPDITSMPNLVPTSSVNPDTWSSDGTWTGIPDFMPTTVVHLGTTTGCEVSMSAYTFNDQLAYSYVTHCSGPIQTQATTAALASCCGGESDVYPCNDAGSMPSGTARWRCTMSDSTYAGTRFATTTWS